MDLQPYINYLALMIAVGMLLILDLIAATAAAFSSILPSQNPDE